MHNPLHLYVVFNPMLNKDEVYQSQAHEFYFNLKNKVKLEDPQNSFMYWGKLKVNDSHSSNLDDFKSIIEENKSNGDDTHLFISDYHHFWVAKVESVHSEIFNKDHSLPFYDDKNVELWFKVSDMDLLSAEFEETSLYLNQLYVENKFVSEKIDKIDPYVGGLQFPLPVQDRSSERYFGNVFSGEGLRVNRDNALIDNPQMSGEISHQVKSFVIPPHVFSKISNIIKSEILTVETILAKREKDNPKLFEKIVNSYLKILENIMSDTLGAVLKLEYGNCLYISKEGDAFFDHKTSENISINEFKNSISMKAFMNLLKDVSQFGNLSLSNLEQGYPELVYYFVNKLGPLIVEHELVEKREQFKQHKLLSITKSDALSIRNEILGVGCKGVINKLINLTMFTEKEEQYKDIA